MIDEIIRSLNKAASPLEHLIYVSKWIKQAAEIENQTPFARIVQDAKPRKR